MSLVESQSLSNEPTPSYGLDFDRLVGEHENSTSALMAHIRESSDIPPRPKRRLEESDAFAKALEAAASSPKRVRISLPVRRRVVLPTRPHHLVSRPVLAKEFSRRRVDGAEKHRPALWYLRKVARQRTTYHKFTMPVVEPSHPPFVGLSRPKGRIPVHQDHPMLNFRVIFQHTTAVKGFKGYELLAKLASILAPTTWGSIWLEREVDASKALSYIKDFQRWVERMMGSGTLAGDGVVRGSSPPVGQLGHKEGGRLGVGGSPIRVEADGIGEVGVSDNVELEKARSPVIEDGPAVAPDASPARASPSASSSTSSSSSSSGSTCSRGNSCPLLSHRRSSPSRAPVTIPAIRPFPISLNSGRGTSSPHPSFSESVFEFDSDLRIKVGQIDDLLGKVPPDSFYSFFLKLLLVNHPRLSSFVWSDPGYSKNEEFRKIKDGLIDKLLSEEFRAAFKSPSAPPKAQLLSVVRNYAGQHKKRQKDNPNSRRPPPCPYKALAYFFES